MENGARDDRCLSGAPRTFVTASRRVEPPVIVPAMRTAKALGPTVRSDRIQARLLRGKPLLPVVKAGCRCLYGVAPECFRTPLVSRSARLKYYGMLVPNARLRQAVTARACEARPTGNASVPSSAEGEEQTGNRSATRYLWAMLLARLYDVLPLLCPSCGAPMRIIAFITDTPANREILDHIGEPSTQPPLVTARGPLG